MGPEPSELGAASSLLCRAGAIAGRVARAAGGVDVGGADASVGDAESPLQATAAINARPRAIPKNVLRINLDPDFNLSSLSVELAYLLA
jgi:hypothetical protein|tara:strand:+ start:11734 stop:12000 length:267 start_codon:yes stop_codon:yes gene_type:complete